MEKKKKLSTYKKHDVNIPEILSVARLLGKASASCETVFQKDGVGCLVIILPRNLYRYFMNRDLLSLTSILIKVRKRKREKVEKKKGSTKSYRLHKKILEIIT